MQWRYIRKGTIKDESVGPISANDLQKLFFAKKINGDTLVCHPTETENQWRPLSSAAIYQAMSDNLRAARLKAAEEEIAQKAMSDNLRAARLKATEEEIAQHRERVYEEQEIARQEDRQLKTRIGADHWPNMFRCAQVYEVVAVLMAVVFGGSVLLLAASPLMGGLASLASGDDLGIGLGVVMLAVALLVVVVDAVLGYLLYISMMCWAELLRCFAAIEANTRTMWDSNGGDGSS